MQNMDFCRSIFFSIKSCDTPKRTHCSCSCLRVNQSAVVVISDRRKFTLPFIVSNGVCVTMWRVWHVSACKLCGRFWLVDESNDCGRASKFCLLVLCHPEQKNSNIFSPSPSALTHHQTQTHARERVNLCDEQGDGERCSLVGKILIWAIVITCPAKMKKRKRFSVFIHGLWLAQTYENERRRLTIYPTYLVRTYSIDSRWCLRTLSCCESFVRRWLWCDDSHRMCCVLRCTRRAELKPATCMVSSFGIWWRMLTDAFVCRSTTTIRSVYFHLKFVRSLFYSVWECFDGFAVAARRIDALRPIVCTHWHPKCLN